MMIFRQPNDLARAINFLLDQLREGEAIELILTHRDRDSRVRLHLLAAVNEVARLRHVSVQVIDE